MLNKIIFIFIILKKTFKTFKTFKIIKKEYLKKYLKKIYNIILMYLLLGTLILMKVSLGVLYCKNKDYINIKLFNKSTEIILYTKKNILSKCINNDFHITDVELIHNNKKINIYYYLYYNLIISNKFTNKIYYNILKDYKIEKNEDTRILIKYKLNNISYMLYWTGENLNNKIITNKYIKKLKNRYYMNKSTKESVYMLLLVDMNNIVKILYNDTEINKEDKLYNIINMFKGPLNDYGYLLNCNIKHKWIYDDFNLEKKCINIEQGYKINELLNLESFSHKIEYDDKYLCFDIFEKI